MKLEILDAQRNVIRTYQSSNVPPGPHPATDPEAYNKICQQNPSAPDCGLPLYWPAPPQILKTSAGMHRFLWDMHYDAVPGTVGGRRGGDDEGGAVPHRTAPEIDAPWAAPGQYSVRLSVDGQAQSQPLLVLLDPRVKVTPEAEVIFTMTKQVEDAARRAAKARSEAEAMIAKLQGATSTATSQAQLKSLQELVPADSTASWYARYRKYVRAQSNSSYFSGEPGEHQWATRHLRYGLSGFRTTANGGANRRLPEATSGVHSAHGSLDGSSRRAITPASFDGLTPAPAIARNCVCASLCASRD